MIAYKREWLIIVEHGTSSYVIDKAPKQFFIKYWPPNRSDMQDLSEDEKRVVFDYYFNFALWFWNKEIL